MGREHQQQVRCCSLSAEQQAQSQACPHSCSCSGNLTGVWRVVQMLPPQGSTAGDACMGVLWSFTSANFTLLNPLGSTRPCCSQNTAGATGKPQSHELQDAESRDRAPVDSRRNTNDLRSKFDKNFITFCFHKMMRLGAECELRGIEHNTAMNPQVPSHPANRIHMTFALSEVWL